MSASSVRFCFGSKDENGNGSRDADGHRAHEVDRNFVESTADTH